MGPLDGRVQHLPLEAATKLGEYNTMEEMNGEKAVCDITKGSFSASCSSSHHLESVKIENSGWTFVIYPLWPADTQ